MRRQESFTKSEVKQWKKPAAFLAAGLLGAAVIGSTIGGNLSFSLNPSYAQSSAAYAQAPNFADLVEKVRPAVVSVNVKGGMQKGPNSAFKGLPDLPEDHPLNDFFKRFKKDYEEGQPSPMAAQGSGFIISEDGFVVTNNHVIDKAEEISVTLDSGEELKAKLIGSDSRTDLALLKIEKPQKYPFVEFGEKEARVGEWVLAVGNPFGLGGTVTAGIVSARARDIGSGPYDYIQIDAAVNRGNSGGPTFNLEGKVIGVNTAIYSPSGGNVGIAFAVPASVTKDVIEQLKKSGSVSRGWLGVTIQNVTEDIAASIGMKKPLGAMVTGISKGGPAENSELKAGDVIVSVNGTEIKDSRDLARKIAALEPKFVAKITVFRDGANKEISIALGLFPGVEKIAAMESGGGTGREDVNDLGMSLAPAASKPGSGSEGVVIVDIDPQSEAAQKGLKKGDVILKIGKTTIVQPDDVSSAVAEAKKAGQTSVLLYLKAGDQRRFIALPLKKS